MKDEKQHPAVPEPDPDSPMQGLAKLREKLNLPPKEKDA